jgi:hypothetical protein
MLVWMVCAAESKNNNVRVGVIDISCKVMRGEYYTGMI